MLLEALAVGEPEQQKKKKKEGPVKMSIATTSNSKLLDYDDKRSGRSSGVAYERPLIAVPFKWEAEPGVPKLKPVAKAGQQSPKLAPPPRLMSDKSLLQKDNAAAAAARPSPLLSPRSPRSISLSKKMRSLLQGKLYKYSNSRRISDERMSSSPCGSERSQESSSSFLFWETMGDSDSADTEESIHMHVKHMLYNAASCVPLGDSDHIVFEGEQLNLRMDEPRSSDSSDPPIQQSRSGFMPFRNMSTMLLELWYGGGYVDSAEGHRILNGGFDISPSSSDSLESPGSYNSSSSFSSDYDNHPPPPRHFKTGLDAFGTERYEQLPKKFQDMDFDEHHDYRDDEDFSIDFDCCSSSSDLLLAKKLYYKSDRFRVESSQSAALCGPSEEDKKQEEHVSVHDERLNSLQLQPLPSALKSGKRGSSSRKSMKRVRFADDGLPSSSAESEEQEIVCSRKFSSPALERYSSRPASRFSSDEDDAAEDNNAPSAAEDESSYSSPSPSPSPSPRPRRDLSELFMQIVQADAEITRRQKRGAFKSMFRSTRRY